MSESARVIEDYESAYPDPLRLRKGERVAVEERECEWPGWLWATDSSGRAGWIPAAYLSVSDDAGELLRDYDATELSVRTSEELVVEKEESGWLWCTNRAGQHGWVPANHVEW